MVTILKQRKNEEKNIFTTITTLKPNLGKEFLKPADKHSKIFGSFRKLQHIYNQNIILVYAKFRKQITQYNHKVLELNET